MVTRQSIDIDKEIRNIPPLPGAFTEIMHKINDEVPDYTTLAGIISKDPALVSRVLIVANSSFYGFSGRINGIKEACLILGLHTIRHIAFTVGVLMQLSTDKKGRPNIDHQKLWYHSLGAGVVARTFAAYVREDPDTAFTAGLLHDIGKIIFDVYFTNEYARVVEHRDQEGCSLFDAENAVLGIDHCHIGARVANKWRLPDTIIAVIEHHHRPSQTTPSAMIDLVHFGDVMSRRLSIGDGGDGNIPDLDLAAMARLGIDPQDIETLLPEIKKHVELGKFVLG